MADIPISGKDLLKISFSAAKRPNGLGTGYAALGVWALLGIAQIMNLG